MSISPTLIYMLLCYSVTLACLTVSCPDQAAVPASIKISPKFHRAPHRTAIGQALHGLRTPSIPPPH